MTVLDYPCPLAGGGTVNELVVGFDRARAARVLLIPALFAEANSLRRLCIEVMRRLDGAGIDSFLPDLPGTNESLAPLAGLDPEDWRTAIGAAARHFGASHVLALRGGGLLAPQSLPGWLYGPVKGASLVRTLLRARLVSEREAGRETTLEALFEAGERGGLELAGYALSAEMLRQLQTLEPQLDGALQAINQDLIGGSPLWLRAEPDFDPLQADALAATIVMALRT